MTLPQVAEYLHCHPTTIYRLLQRRQIPAFHLGGDWRFRRTDVREWIAQQSALADNEAPKDLKLKNGKAPTKQKRVRAPKV
jgi:excisionase family DNA binding protein